MFKILRCVPTSFIISISWRNCRLSCSLAFSEGKKNNQRNLSGNVSYVNSFRIKRALNLFLMGSFIGHIRVELSYGCIIADLHFTSSKLKTKTSWILLSFFFDEVLEQLKTNIYTNFTSIVRCVWIFKLLRDSVFTWLPLRAVVSFKRWLILGILLSVEYFYFTVFEFLDERFTLL